MDYNLVLGEKRWDILELLSKRPLSPIEVAKKMNVTVSYISQQLKLLEIAGLVGNKKTGNTEKGRPRKIYFVKKGFVSLGFLDKNFSFRKTLETDDYSRAVMNIYSLSSNFHYPLQKFFWSLDCEKNKILGLFFEKSSGKVLILTLLKSTANFVKQILKKHNLDLKTKIILEKDLESLDDSSLVVLYDPQNFYCKTKEEENE